jgi:AmmeMemoRadiSam system protein B
MPASAKTHSFDSTKIRQPIVDGLFYPRAPDELEREIDSLLARAHPGSADAWGIITPHAALSYVGELLALAYKSASNRPIKNVVILAPLHGDRSKALFLSPDQGFATPLGTVRINQQVSEKLLNAGLGFSQNNDVFEEEQSVEVQIPFIQRLFPDAMLLPVLVGEIGAREVDRLSTLIKGSFGQTWHNVLAVATTNTGSFRETQSSDSVNQQKRSFMKLILKGKPRELIEAMRRGEVSACGAQCVAVLLALIGENHRVEMMKEADSRGISPSHDAVVHYSAISLHKESDD